MLLLLFSGGSSSPPAATQRPYASRYRSGYRVQDVIRAIFLMLGLG